MDEPTIRYSKGEITVLWKPDRCIHSGICVRGLPKVFDVKRRPWVDMTGAEEAEIIAKSSGVRAGRSVGSGTNLKLNSAPLPA